MEENEFIQPTITKLSDDEYNNAVAAEKADKFFKQRTKDEKMYNNLKEYGNCNNSDEAKNERIEELNDLYKIARQKKSATVDLIKSSIEAIKLLKKHALPSVDVSDFSIIRKELVIEADEYKKAKTKAKKEDVEQKLAIMYSYAVYLVTTKTSNSSIDINYIAEAFQNAVTTGEFADYDKVCKLIAE